MGLRHARGSIGVDEAGRGPLAGPVVVAAVLLPDRFTIKGLDDSKKLTPEQRETQAERIKARARYAVVRIETDEIESLNILWATMRGMELAVAELGLDAPILVDGNQTPRGLIGRAQPVIKGDSRYACIAAASILAKTTRDAIMRSYALDYPAYGFDRHFGYATPDHLEAIREHGPCPIHRLSFAPFKESEQLCLTFD